MKKSYLDNFFIEGKLVVITGAAGLLGRMHAYAVIEAKGIPVLLDINEEQMAELNTSINEKYPDARVYSYVADITKKETIEAVLADIVSRGEKVYGLINNAACNPDMKNVKDGVGRLEEYDLDIWNMEIAVGLTGAFICSQVFGSHMAENNQGVIINISSDLGVIAPTQYLYEIAGADECEQPKKPVTYSIIKTGLIGLTRYLATYWADKNVRSNALAFGGVFNNQNPDFLDKLLKHIPLGRMADKDEYVNTIIYVLSDASKYMNGAVVLIDGGRTAW